MIESKHYIKIFKALPLPGVLLLTDAPKFTIAEVNTAWLTITGTESEALLGKSIFEVPHNNFCTLPANVTSALLASLLEVMETKQPSKIPAKYSEAEAYNTMDAHISYYDIENVPVLDDDGNVSTIIHTIIDVTDKVLLQNLKSQFCDGAAKKDKDAPIKIDGIETSLKALLNGTNDLAWSIDIYMRLITANKAFATAIERKTGKILAEGDLLLLHGIEEEVKNKWFNYYGRALAGETYQAKEEYYDPVAQRTEYSIITFTPILDTEQKVVGVACYSKDVTEQTIIQQVVEKTKTELNKILLDVICTLDGAGKFIKVAEACNKLWGYTSEELGGRLFTDFVPKNNGQEVAHWFRNMMTSEDAINLESGFRKKNGGIVPMFWTARWSADNQIIYCVGRDATKQKKAELEMQLLINNTEESFVLIDNDLRVVRFNQQFVALLKNVFNKIAGIGDSMLSYSRPETVENARAICKRVLTGGEEIQELHIGEGKFEKVFKVKYKPALNEKGAIIGIFLCITDITENKRALLKIDEINKRNHYITQATSDAIWDWDITDDSIYWGDGYQTSFGYNLAEMKYGLSAWSEHIYPEDFERVIKSIYEFIDGTETHWEDQYRFYRAGGTLAHVIDRAVAIRNEQGKAIRMVGGMRDITEKKELENLLSKVNNLARIGGWEINLSKNKLYWSDITREIHETAPGFEPDIEKGTGFYKEGKSRNLIVQKISAAIKTGTPWDEELEIITARGREKWVRVIGEADFANGKCIRVYGSFQDIDVRKKAELAVIRTLEEKNIILESIGDAFFAVDKNWTVTYWNTQAEKVLHTPKTKIIGHHLWDVFSDSIGSVSHQKYHQALETNQAIRFEDYYPPLNKWYEISAYPSESGLSVYFKDITERKIAEIKQKEAAAQQSLFVSIVNSSDDAIISKTLDGIITSWNHSAENLFGFTKGEAVGKHISIIIPPRLIHEELDIITKIKNGEYVKHFETERLRKDGSCISVSLTVSPVIDSNGTTIGASKIARDITEKKKAEDALRLSNERYNLVAKATNDSIWDWDIATGIVTRPGDGFTKLFGHKVEPANDSDISWLQLVHPEDAQKVKNKQSAILNNKNEFYWEDEYRFLKANNHYAYVHGKGYIIRDENGKATRLIGATQDVTKLKEQVFEITRIQQNLDSLINNTVDQIWSVNTDFKIITANKAYKNLIEHLTGAPVTEGDKAIYQVIGEALANKWKGLYTRALSGDTFSIEESVTNPVTAETVHGIISFSPIIDGEGQVTGVACFAKDITELKNASNKVGEMNKALQQKAEELALSNAELEQFAYVASHDLQEPLRMVTSFLTQIEKKYSGIIDDKGRTYIHFAVDGAKRMRQIILDLLEFSRVGKGNETKENVDLNILVKEVEMLLRKQVEEKNAYILLGRLPIINTYIAPLTQVFQNLISNALKYSKVGIAPQIRITAASLATHWQFAITDNGIGLSEEYFDKIFIIFQRLHNKDEYSGTGMGLAIAKKIVEGLGGKIWVESEEGKGSTFYFTLLKD